MGLHVSTIGTYTQDSPKIKRATGINIEGEKILVVPDANIPNFNGDGTPGVPGFRLYKVDRDNTSTTLIGEHSALVSQLGSPAVCSFVSDPQNMEYHFVYYDYEDNSLKYIWMNSVPATWSVETIIPGNSVSNRFRAVDVDIITGWQNLAVIVYEALDNSGMGAAVKVYIRNDSFNWVLVWEEQLFDSEFIRQGSEDVSISFLKDARKITQAARFFVYYTKTSTTTDYGDTIRDITYNFLSDETTVNGSWTDINANIAPGLRRAWLFKVPSNDIQVGMVAGSGQPKFQAMRLTPGVYTTPTVNTNTIPTSVAAGAFPALPQIDTSSNFFSSISCSYKNDSLIFGFITSNTVAYGPSAGKPLLVSLVFRYEDSTSKSAFYVDNQFRPLDGFEKVVDRPVAIYGGDNSGYFVEHVDNRFYWMAWYGRINNEDTFTANVAHLVYNRPLDPPIIVAPGGAVSLDDTPLLQVNVQQTSEFYPSVLGKVEWHLSKSADFGDDLRIITEPDTNFRYYGSITNNAPPPIVVSYKPTSSERLNSGVWYQRARLIDDFGGSSLWSVTRSFEIFHAPVANPVSPAPGSVIEFRPDGINFSWIFSDTNDGDTQAAYQVIVSRVDSGAAVVDTGMIVSSKSSVIIPLGPELKDIPLQWSVSLWDRDGTQGPFSTPTLFTMSDAVAVAVTSPINGQTIDTASPIVAWQSTFVGNRTQKACRVIAYRSTVFDTFDRLVSAGFGVSSSGSQWTVEQDGPAADYSADGTVGRINVTLKNKIYTAVNDISVKNARQEVVFTPSAVATGDAYSIRLVARWSGSQRYYTAFYNFGIDSKIKVFVEKRNGAFVWESITPEVDTGVVYSPGQPVKLIFDIFENQFRIKVHNLSDPEPGSWDVVCIDSEINSPGKCGIGALILSGNTNQLPMELVFDNYLVIAREAASVADSGWISGQVGSFSFPSNIFENNKFYTIRTLVQDSVGLTGESLVTVKTDWTEPDTGDLIVTTDPFSVILNWTNANIDPNFIAWRVYRKYMVPSIPELDEEDSANTWVLIYETREVKPNYTFRDYLAPLNKPVTYTVVQLVDRFGSLIESDITSTVTTTLIGDRYFFVPSEPIGSIAAFQAKNVTADGFTAEVEQATLHVRGRGRQVQIGDDLGVSGSLTIKLRDPETARADREFIQRLASSKTAKVYIKSPFGDVILARLGNISVTRVPGVGLAEFVDLTVPYTEVYEEVPITRR